MWELALSVGSAVFSAAAVWVSMVRRISKMETTLHLSLENLNQHVAGIRTQIAQVQETLVSMQAELHEHDRTIAVIQAKMQNGAHL